MPCLSVGLKVPEVTVPTSLPSPSMTAHPGRGMPRPVTLRPRRSGADFATRWATSASLPQKVSLSQPTAHAARPMTGVISGVRSLPWSG